MTIVHLPTCPRCNWMMMRQVRVCERDDTRYRVLECARCQTELMWAPELQRSDDAAAPERGLLSVISPRHILTSIPPYTGNERRIVPRSHILLVSRINFGNRVSLDCTVRNLSPSGAALLLKNALDLPMKFELSFDDVTRHCIVVWRRPYWIWPAPGSEDTELGVLMELEVRHGEAEVYP
jgi:hypothetical protein